MSTPPYAKVLMSLNGGGPVTGFQTPRAFSDTIQLSGESLTGWLTVLWVIFGFPPSWAVPAGWAAQGDGTIASTDFTPTLITLPTSAVNVFGAWGGRLVVNGGLKNGLLDKTMTDETWGWEIPSPSLGLTEPFALEGIQRDPLRAWVKPIQDNMRRIEASLGSVAGSVTSNAVALKMGLYLP